MRWSVGDSGHSELGQAQPEFGLDSGENGQRHLVATNVVGVRRAHLVSHAARWQAQLGTSWTPRKK